MAITTTILTPTAQLFPWSGLGDVNREVSAVPRQEVWFQILGEEVTAGGVGNEQALAVTCTLPANFSYAMTDFYFTLMGQTAGKDSFGNTWTRRINAFIQNNATTSTSDQVFFNSIRTTNDDNSDTYNEVGKEMQMWNLPQSEMPSPIFKGMTGASCVFGVNAFNWTQASAAVDCFMFARFLMYDYSQAYNWASNTPQLTR